MQTLIATLIFIVLLALVYLMWRYLLQRGFRRVVAVFREHGALDPKSAKTLQAMGLQEGKGMFGTNMFKPRDYRQTAMRFLGQQGIIRMTEGERFYLSEDALANSRIRGFVGPR